MFRELRGDPSQRVQHHFHGFGLFLELPFRDVRRIDENQGESGGDFYGWGREVLATGCGTVVYSRNDVPDNIRPGETDVNLFSKLPDPLWAIGGNSIVIDHGNGEFSFLAHMQKGSIRVKAGDTVQQGQVIGLLGSPGHADAAHGLIVGAAVTDAANDTAQLLPAVDRLEQRLNKRPQQMVADRGYTTRENIEKMAAEKSIFWEPCGMCHGSQPTEPASTERFPLSAGEESLCLPRGQNPA